MSSQAVNRQFILRRFTETQGFTTATMSQTKISPEQDNLVLQDIETPPTSPPTKSKQETESTPSTPPSAETDPSSNKNKLKKTVCQKIFKVALLDHFTASPAALLLAGCQRSHAFLTLAWIH